jgi:hypothetical protein
MAANRPLVIPQCPYFVLKDIPSFAALTLVAPGERFNALAIFLTPCLSFAIDFNNFRSSLVHARLTTFLFLAISVPFFGAGLLSWLTQFAIRRRLRGNSTLEKSYLRVCFFGTDSTNVQRSSSIWRAKSKAFAFNTFIA